MGGTWKGVDLLHYGSVTTRLIPLDSFRVDLVQKQCVPNKAQYWLYLTVTRQKLSL